MKNLFKNLMLVAVAAMAFTACQNDNNEVNNVAKESTIEFTAGFDASRSQFGEKDGEGYPSFWNGGEYVFVDLVATDGDTSTTAYMEKVDDAGASANFKATFYGVYTDATITVYSPYHNTSNLSGWRDADYDGVMDPNIPATQTPNANSVEAAAHILKAEHTFAGALTSGYANLTFEHAVAYGKMTLNLGDVVAFEDIASVRVVFGEQAYTLLPDNLTEPTFWFACKEAEVETMTITITDTNDVTYVREITTSVEKPLAFVTGQVSKFAVGGFEEVELEFVTSISASYDQSNSRVKFIIDTVKGSHIELYMPEVYEGGLLPECDEWYYLSSDVWYNNLGTLWYVYGPDPNMWADYRNIEEVDFVISYLEEGYDITFWFIDSAGEEWEPFSYSGIIPGICNPPAPEAVNVVDEAETVSASGSSRYYTFAFEAGNYAFSNFWVDTEVEGLVIAEGEYSPSDAVVAYLDEEGNETGWSFDIVEGKVTVAHDTENQQYILTFELEDANGSTFTVTYVGEVEGVYAPGAATPLDAPEFDWEAKSATPTTMTVAWYAVDGAASYKLYYTYYADGEQTSEPVTTEDTTYTFEGLTQGMYYNVYVKALPASESNLESDYSSISVETPYDPATFEADYTITTDQFEDLGGMKLKFYNEAGDYFIVPFNPYATELAAGSYTNNYGYPYAEPLTTYDGYNVEISGHQHAGYNFKFFVVEKDGDNYTIALATPNNSGEMVKCVFSGALEVAEVEALVFTSAVADGVGSNYVNVTFTNGENTLVAPFGIGALNNYINAGTWSNALYFDSGFALNNCYYNEVYQSSVVINVEVVDGKYSMDITIGATKAEFVGTVENLVLPGEVVESEATTLTVNNISYAPWGEDTEVHFFTTDGWEIIIDMYTAKLTVAGTYSYVGGQYNGLCTYVTPQAMISGVQNNFTKCDVIVAIDGSTRTWTMNFTMSNKDYTFTYSDTI